LHIFDGLIAILTEWKQTQRALFKTLTVEHNNKTPVANNELGGFLAPNGYSSWFRHFCVANGFGSYETITKTTVINGKTHINGTNYHGLTPHQLRHTHASLLIGSSIDIKAVQSSLGHANFNLTLNTYAHLIDANDKVAAETFSGLLKRSGKKVQ
jgi:integrase